MKQQPGERVSSEWEESPRSQETRAIWGVGAHLQAALHHRISVGTSLLLVITAMMVLIGIEALFGAGMLVGALLVPHLIIHASQAAPIQP